MASDNMAIHIYIHTYTYRCLTNKLIHVTTYVETNQYI